MERHRKIVELIGKYEIETQEELAEKLTQAGFNVTQATVSRDIRELKLTKIPGENGRQRYMVLESPRGTSASKYIRILKDGHEIHKDDIMGMADGGILSTGSDINSVTIDMISNMLTEDSELISLYYGADITEAAANGLLSKLNEAYPDIDIELNAGGQPVYYYIVSVE